MPKDTGSCRSMAESECSELYKRRVPGSTAHRFILGGLTVFFLGGRVAALGRDYGCSNSFSLQVEPAVVLLATVLANIDEMKREASGKCGNSND